MNENYYVIQSALNTFREILMNVLPSALYQKECEKIENAKDWFEELAINDHCKKDSE